MDAFGPSLAAQGRVAWLITRGRASGRARGVAVGFVDEPDGSILVAANSAATAWARNLQAHPEVTVRIGERAFEALAEPLDEAAHARAVGALILRYGTPAERLGRGPSFRLVPVADGPTEGA
ncbi:MAG: nitroreductase family deazaflavin-dependent oxidoreductase [Candidatus Limnocylindria bacterium]